MKKQVFFVSILTIAFILLGNNFVLAQKGNQGTRNLQLEVKSTNQEDSSSVNLQQGKAEKGNKREEKQQQMLNEIKEEPQSQNQVRNQGEDQQIQNNEKKGNMIQRRSQVANAVQEMLQVAERNGGIGEQIRTIAQNQKQNQEKIENSLTKVQNRNTLTRFIAGPNYGEINNAQKILEQNRQHIEQLNQIKDQIINQVDQEQILEQIQSLEQVNSEIESSLEEAQKGFSLFGWLFKAFSR